MDPRAPSDTHDPGHHFLLCPSRHLLGGATSSGAGSDVDVHARRQHLHRIYPLEERRVNLGAEWRRRVTGTAPATVSEATTTRLPRHATTSTLLSTGDPIIDAYLHGGLVADAGTIVEIAGESATAKTQLCLQLCVGVAGENGSGVYDASGVASGTTTNNGKMTATLTPPTTYASAVYLCTEDRFPLARLHQLIIARYPTSDTCTASAVHDRILSNIHLIHLFDMDIQQHVLAYQLPELLRRLHDSDAPVRLIVVDSVAGNLRYGQETSAAEEMGSDMTTHHGDFLLGMASQHHQQQQQHAKEGIERARKLQALGAHLKLLSDRYGLAVVCVNQVTARIRDDLQQDVIGGSATARTMSAIGGSEDMVPALGQTWMNQLTMRVLLEKPSGSATMHHGTHDDDGRTTRRHLRVAFAPHVPYRRKPLGIHVTARGVSSVSLPKDD